MGKFSLSMPIIPISILTKIQKCICKITIESKYGVRSATGFFMKVNNSSRYLVSCYHAIGDAIKNNKEIELKIRNEDRITLACNGRFTKAFKDPLDIAVVEIKDSDSISNTIDFLDYDMNYMKGYSIYQNVDVFMVFFGSDKIRFSVGKIKEIKENEFGHDISSEGGSSGCPIILTSNNQVIGIHIGCDVSKKLNIGNFIGQIIKAINIPNQINSNVQNKDKNKIFINNNNYNINNNKINTIINNKIKFNIDNNVVNYNQNHNSVNYNNNNNNNNINKIINPIELYLDITKNEKDTQDIIIIYIKSIDQSLNCKIRCKNSDKFNKIVNIILEKEPKFTDQIGFFMCKGTRVNEYRSLKDNGIKNDDVILLNSPD